MKPPDLTRRQALAAYAALMAASRGRAQKLAGEPPGRIPPVDELVNAAELEAIAQRKLDPLTFAAVQGSERAAFDRITFRPRLMVDTRKIDLSTNLFGQTLFTPILVGPVSDLNRYHPEGELAMARGASASNAILVVAGRSGYPLEKIAAQSKAPLWCQVDLDADANDLRSRVEQATAAGCKALCVTAGAAGIDWKTLDSVRKGVRVPVVLKGVMSPEEAKKTVSAGLQGIVVSNYSAHPVPGVASAIEVLPAVADAVAGKVPVLMDGSVRLGSDVMKALALGAQAVLIARPAVWGLAAYGADGVRTVLELIQSEFARDMAMCGRVNIQALDRTAVRLHRR